MLVMPFARASQHILVAALVSTSACSEPGLSNIALDGSDEPSTGSSAPSHDAGPRASSPVREPDAGGGEPRGTVEDAGSMARDADVASNDASLATANADAPRPAPRDAASDTRDASSPSSPASYTLTIDMPANGATLKSPVNVRGRAAGFLNVEVWDAQHQNPPLTRVAPKPDGSFEASIDVSSLSNGPTSWTVHAWDSAAGAPFAHSDSVELSLTLQTSNTAPPPPAGGAEDPGTKYVPSGYRLAFSDEFTASALDTAKWNTLAPFAVHFYADSKQKQYFVPEAVTLSGGTVRFTARKATGNTEGQPYSSGSITTNGTFTHGYFESRVKVPAGKGFWPAYWLTSSTRWPPEWDIFEIIDNVIFGYTHPVAGGKCSFVDGAAGSDATYTIANLYGTWHVYGFLWTASDLYWYVDGVTTEHYSVNAAAGANDPFWLNLSLQVGGDWPGDPNASTPFPGVMEVDYVRVYQN